MMMKGESIEIPIGDALTNKITVPVSTFRDETQAKQWADHAFRSFRARSTAALLSEAALTLGDEANWALDDLKIESMDMQEVVQAHIKDTTKRLQERFNLQRPGRQSQWDRLELMEAMKAVLNLLPEQDRTIANAATRLKETHPDKAPESSEALRKVMKRQGISWKGLKKELQASN
jgi:gas vesicle protein